MHFMEIVHIAAELAPIAKVGGLGDVLLGLGRSLIKKGHQVEIILPKYDCLDFNEIENTEVKIHDFHSFFDGEWHHNTIWQGKIKGIPLTLIESHDPYEFFDRQTVYGCPDDISRFSYFSRIALEYLHKTKRKPDIIHVHDWHAALVPVLLKTAYSHSPIYSAHSILTIHNLAYQGICDKPSLLKIGLKEEHFDQPDLLRDLHTPQAFNLLQGGIVYADCITTVSPNYAQEVMTPEGGKGLESVLRRYAHKFSGVLNGIDYTYWNPETDHHLPFHYSASSLSPSTSHPPFIEEKRKIQTHLRHILSLEDESCPIVGCVTRLVYQKGPELIKHALLKTLERGGQFILVGSAMDPKTHTEFYNLKRKLAASRHAHIELSYNEPLSHLVYAASDLFIVPSLFEPCGLTQMIAMRYGALPLVRETGGLKDTVAEGKNGFTFGLPTAEGISPALDRAFSCWFEQPQCWYEMVQTGMKKDFCWDSPADEYLKIYHALKLQKRVEFSSVSS